MTSPGIWTPSRSGTERLKSRIRSNPDPMWPKNILVRLRAAERFHRNGSSRSAVITIFKSILHRAAIDLPYHAHAALEIDHAAAFGGNPPSFPCARHVLTD